MFYILSETITSNTERTLKKERIVFGEAGDIVEHVSDHDNVVIVKNKKHIFPVGKDKIFIFVEP